jgi:hypothetical protein
METMWLRLTPLLYIFVAGDRSLIRIVSYAVAVPALYAAGAALYSRRPLERAGDSIVFPAFEAAFTLIITFAGMALMSVLFDVFGWGAFPLNAGSAIGAALCLIASRMVMKKSARVFNKSTLLHGGAFVCAAALFLCVLGFDLTGYEKRVPDPGRVEYAQIGREFVPPLQGRSFSSSAGNELTFTEPENIRHVTELHSAIAQYDGRPVIPGGFLPFGYFEYSNVYLRYGLGGGQLARNWNISTEYLRDDPSARALFESEEYKLQNDVSSSAWGRPQSISVTAAGYSYGNGEDAVIDQIMPGRVITLSSDEYGGLLGALSEDMRRETWDEMIAARPSVVTVEINYVEDPYESDKFSAFGNSYAGIAVPAHYARTLEWLAERGYYSRLTKWREDIVSARLTRYATADGVEYSYIGGGLISSPELILRAIDNSERVLWNPRDYWAMSVSGGDGAGNEEEVYVAYFSAGSAMAEELLAAAG